MKVINIKNKPTKKKAKSKMHDWEAIEPDIITCRMSLRAVGRKHGVSEGAIRKYIKRNNIERDLTVKVKVEVRKKLVRNAVRKKTQLRKDPKSKVRADKNSSEPKLTEKEMIEAAAEENISFIQTWDEIFQKSVKVAKALKKDILKRVSVKLDEKKSTLVDKYTPNQKATVYNSVVNAETKLFEAMRKNLGIDESGGQEAPALLMDYGTGNYEAELERRKTGTDSV